MNLTIIIVTYNSGHVLETCISSLGNFKTNVLVVDNNSGDDTVRKARGCGVRVIQNGANVGFGRAANRGAQEASGQTICFLNPDCEPQIDFFPRGLSVLEGHPKRCAVPQIIRHDGSVTEGMQFGYTRKKLFWDMIQTNYGESRLTRWLKKHPRFHDTSWTWPLGTCLLIQRNFFLSLNGFDERYFMYCEDVDLGRRVWDAGGEVHPIDCEVRHAIQDSSRIPRLHKKRLLDSGRIMYGKLHYGMIFALILRVTAWASRVLHSGRALFRGLLH
jgi:hypothetical protein